MKKKMLALAVLAAVGSPAFAQNVSLSGRFDVSVQSVGSGAVTTTQVSSGVWGSPRLTLKMGEDLGGGLKAGVTHETGITTDTGAMTMGDRDSNIFFAGAFGEVKLGRTTSLATDADVFVNAFGGNQGLVGKRWMTTTEVATSASLAASAGANTANDGLGDKVTNSVMFVTPIMSGLQAQIQAGFGEDTTVGEKGNGDLLAYAVTYTSGNLKAVATSAKQKRKGTTVTYGDIKQSSYGINYNFGMAQAGLVITSQDRDTKATNDKFEVSVLTVNMPVGNGISLFAALHNGEVKGLASSKTSATVVGASKDFSKRTKGYVTYAKTTNEAAINYNVTGQSAAADADGLDPKSLSVGVIHFF